MVQSSLSQQVWGEQNHYHLGSTAAQDYFYALKNKQKNMLGVTASSFSLRRFLISEGTVVDSTLNIGYNG